jgi:PadR family transcriptional regulator, regulatory protein PadR
MEYTAQLHQSIWQGMAKLFILHHAAEAPVYGVRLKKNLSNRGYDISPGSLYPLLHTMERAGLLHCRLKVFKGRVRKYYSITPPGESCLQELRQAFSGLAREIFFGNSAPLANHS